MRINNKFSKRSKNEQDRKKMSEKQESVAEGQQEGLKTIPFLKKSEEAWKYR